jgi:hypothetical protein
VEFGVVDLALIKRQFDLGSKMPLSSWKWGMDNAVLEVVAISPLRKVAK